MATKPKIVRSFKDVDALYRQGVNLCKGCPFEHAASCDDSRLSVCNQQLKKYQSMAKSTNQGRNAKRASVLLKQRQREWQSSFKACHGNPKKVKAAAKEYHKKYGATPTARWKRALKDANRINRDTQTTLKMK